MTRLSLFALIFSCLAGAAQAQVAAMPGALEPSQELGCLGYEAVQPTYTAADLALASERCLADGDYDRAVEMFIVMQAFGVFDAQRVLDMSAHQAVAMLGQNIAAAIPADGETAFQEAVGRFGGQGAERHSAVCTHLRAIGPPDYAPDYMVKFGQEAFLYPDDDPIRPDFDAAASWGEVLVRFLGCGALQSQ